MRIRIDRNRGHRVACAGLGGARWARCIGVAVLLVLPGWTWAQTYPTGPEYPPYGEGGLTPFESAFQADMNAVASSNYCNPDSEYAPVGYAACALAQKLAAGSAGALRNVAPQQYSAENSQFKDFAGTQIQELAGRLTAIRSGVNGFQISGLPGTIDPGTPTYAAPARPLGGGASADDYPAGFSRWGGFMNFAYDHGTRAVTDDEDAFHSHAYEFTIGADYRLTRHTVVGAILGYINSNIVFDGPPDAPAAGGSLATKGYSLLVYAQREWDSAYLSGSIGGQYFNQNMQRTGIYSDSATGISTPFTANSSPLARSLLATIAGGYDFAFGAASLEPYFNYQYRDTRIGGFAESGASGDETGSSTPFDVDLEFAAKSITSSQATAGLKLQYALKSSAGVFVPYVDAGYTHEFNAGTYNPTGQFVALYGLVPNFVLPTDPITQNFFAAAGGFTFVAPGGVQAYLRYRQVLGQKYVTSNSIGAGVRIEL